LITSFSNETVVPGTTVGKNEAAVKLVMLVTLIELPVGLQAVLFGFIALCSAFPLYFSA